jgi:hypothetical protein
LKREEWILFLEENNLDRINRIVRITPAFGREALAAGEKFLIILIILSK